MPDPSGGERSASASGAAVRERCHPDTRILPRDGTRSLQVAESLSKHGAKLLLDENRTATIFCFAVKEQKMDLVKALNRFGADINAKDYDDRTALHVRALP
jgi:ankyrin repeat protein